MMQYRYTRTLVDDLTVISLVEKPESGDVPFKEIDDENLIPVKLDKELLFQMIQGNYPQDTFKDKNFFFAYNHYAGWDVNDVNNFNYIADAIPKILRDDDAPIVMSKLKAFFKGEEIEFYAEVQFDLDQEAHDIFMDTADLKEKFKVAAKRFVEEHVKIPSSFLGVKIESRIKENKRNLSFQTNRKTRNDFPRDTIVKKEDWEIDKKIQPNIQYNFRVLIKSKESFTATPLDAYEQKVSLISNTKGALTPVQMLFDALYYEHSLVISKTYPFYITKSTIEWRQKELEEKILNALSDCFDADSDFELSRFVALLAYKTLDPFWEDVVQKINANEAKFYEPFHTIKIPLKSSEDDLKIQTPSAFVFENIFVEQMSDLCDSLHECSASPNIIVPEGADIDEVAPALLKVETVLRQVLEKIQKWQQVDFAQNNKELKHEFRKNFSNVFLQELLIKIQTDPFSHLKYYKEKSSLMQSNTYIDNRFGQNSFLGHREASIVSLVQKYAKLLLNI